MSRAGQHALFDALGTVDKRLHAYPGGHAAESEEQVEAVRQFLRLRLAATAPTAR